MFVPFTMRSTNAFSYRFGPRVATLFAAVTEPAFSGKQKLFGANNRNVRDNALLFASSVYGIIEFGENNRRVYDACHILRLAYVVGSKSFRPDIQKPRQMENAVRDI